MRRDELRDRVVLRALRRRAVDVLTRGGTLLRDERDDRGSTRDGRRRATLHDVTEVDVSVVLNRD